MIVNSTVLQESTSKIHHKTFWKYDASSCRDKINRNEDPWVCPQLNFMLDYPEERKTVLFYPV